MDQTIEEDASATFPLSIIQAIGRQEEKQTKIYKEKQKQI